MVRGYKMEIYKPFRSTSLREARLATIKLIDSTEDIFRSTSLREARQFRINGRLVQYRFRSTSLREARP